MRTQRTIEINAPAEILWVLLTDVEQLKRWTPEIISSEPMSPGPVRVGMRSQTKIKEGSRIVDYEGEITACDEPRHLELLLIGGSLGKNPMRVGYRMVPADDKTTLHYDADWRPQGILLWLMLPLIMWAGRNHASDALVRLKTLAEDEANLAIASLPADSS